VGLQRSVLPAFPSAHVKPIFSRALIVQIQIFNTKTFSWSVLNLPPGFGGALCAAIVSNTAYICGGIVGGTTTNLCTRYNLLNGVFTATPSLPVGVNHAAFASDGNNFLVLGGRSGETGKNVAIILRLSLSLFPSLSLTHSPTHTHTHSLSLLQLLMLARGGPNVPSVGFSHVQLFNPATNSWQSSSQPGSTLAPLPVARGGMGTALFIAGEIYVIGGETPLSTPNAPPNGVYNRVDIYNPTTNSWRMGPSLPQGMHGIYPVYDSVTQAIYIVCGGVFVGPSSSKIFLALSLSSTPISTLPPPPPQSSIATSTTLSASNPFAATTLPPSPPGSCVGRPCAFSSQHSCQCDSSCVA
jgi:hypothetical protein